MGNRLGFCQLHLVDKGIDTGELVKTKEFLYPAHCRIPLEYEKVYNDENLNFILEFIEELTKYGVKLQTKKQLEYFSSYWPRLSTDQNAWIDWGEEIYSLEKFICAFDDPYEGSKTFLNENKIFIKSVMTDFGDQKFHKYQFGLIYRKSSSWLSVCANGGTLIIRKILNENGDDIFNLIRVGDRLITPQKFIESRYKRIIYTPSGQK
jgi:methionyl-tRNA formyltransferase